jgi:hypothetical protein
LQASEKLVIITNGNKCRELESWQLKIIVMINSFHWLLKEGAVLETGAVLLKMQVMIGNYEYFKQSFEQTTKK